MTALDSLTSIVWIWALLSDALQTRWTLIVAQGIIGLIPCIIMSIWTSHPTSVPVSAAYASYFINYVALGTAPLIFAWLSDLIPQDPEARSLVVGVAVAGYYAISAWSQVLVWPASQAPFCESDNLYEKRSILMRSRQIRLAIMHCHMGALYCDDLYTTIYRCAISASETTCFR